MRGFLEFVGDLPRGRSTSPLQYPAWLVRDKRRRSERYRRMCHPSPPRNIPPPWHVAPLRLGVASIQVFCVEFRRTFSRLLKKSDTVNVLLDYVALGWRGIYILQFLEQACPTHIQISEMDERRFLGDPAITERRAPLSTPCRNFRTSPDVVVAEGSMRNHRFRRADGAIVGLNDPCRRANAALFDSDVSDTTQPFCNGSSQPHPSDRRSSREYASLLIHVAGIRRAILSFAMHPLEIALPIQ